MESHEHEHTKGHVCVHDKIDPKHKRSIRAKQEYNHAAKGRRASALAPPPYTSATFIRIHLEFDWTESTATAAQKDYIEGLVKEAQGWLQDSLSVLRLTAPLQLQQECADPEEADGMCTAVAEHKCGEFDVPSTFYADFESFEGGSGVPAADLVLFVSSTETPLCQQTGAQAYAVSCQRDAQTDRPLAGWLNVCHRALPLRTDRLRQLHVNAIIHELVHVLGFSQEHMAYWRNAEDDDYAPRTPRCFTQDWVVAEIGVGPNQCRPADRAELEGHPPWTDSDDKTTRYIEDTTLKSFNERGNTVQKVVTPEAKRQAQLYFDCDNLQGLELENFKLGSAVTESYSLEASHLEKRVFYNELMVREQSSTALDAPRSLFTLALLKDSGWYGVNYDQADPFTRGQGRGCGYAQNKCEPSQQDWCRDGSKRGQCTSDLTAVGDCNAIDYALTADGQSQIPTQYRYFPSEPSRGGDDEMMDFCPMVIPRTNGRCDQASSPNWDLTECEGESCAGMLFGAESICLEGDLWNELFIERKIDDFAVNAGCYLIRCVKDTPEDDSVAVEIFLPDKSWHNCEKANIAALQGDGYVGQITCPANAESICQNRQVVILDDGSRPNVVRPAATPSGASRTWGGGWRSWGALVLMAVVGRGVW